MTKNLPEPAVNPQKRKPGDRLQRAARTRRAADSGRKD
jgi:hypothetical protein